MRTDRMWQGLTDDLYHRLLRLSWLQLVLMFAAFYATLTTGFGLAFYLMEDAVVGADPESFADHVWFSIHTISTVGYGELYPNRPAVQVLVGLESFTSVLGFALMAGLVFSKFSRPTARVRFSEVMTVHDRHGVPTLHFRLANERAVGVLEGSVAVYLV